MYELVTEIFFQQQGHLWWHRLATPKSVYPRAGHFTGAEGEQAQAERGELLKQRDLWKWFHSILSWSKFSRLCLFSTSVGLPFPLMGSFIIQVIFTPPWNLSAAPLSTRPVQTEWCVCWENACWHFARCDHSCSCLCGFRDWQHVGH